MAGLLDMYFPAEDPMNPANLLPQGLLGPSVLSRMQQASDAQRGRWQAGERGPTPLNEDNMWLADDVAGGLLGPMAMAGIFAGVGAKTANKAALETAQRMAGEGVDPRAIWRDTGWFQGPEGKWRWEIDDSGAQLGERKSGYADEVLPHGELYRAYPEMGSLDALIEGYALNPTGKYQPRESREHMGLFDLDEMVSVNAADPIGQRSTMLHELQHAVQGREGFARGASVGEYASGPMFDKRAKDLQADLSQNLTGGITARPPEIIESLKYGNPKEIAAIAQRHGFGSTDEAIEFLRRQDERRTPFGQYQRTAGEAEARAVQKRMDMAPEQRRATFPLDSYDVPLDELIVRRP